MIDICRDYGKQFDIRINPLKKAKKPALEATIISLLPSTE